MVSLVYVAGWIIKASGEVGQRVAFASILERVDLQLDSAADDPDLDQLFDFFISVGVGTNSYVDDLLDFQKLYPSTASKDNCGSQRSES